MTDSNSKRGELAAFRQALEEIYETLASISCSRERPTERSPLNKRNRQIIDYSFKESTWESTFTVPASITDVEAMRDLNRLFRRTGAAREVVDARDFEWYERLPENFPEHCQPRDYSKPRVITLTGLVNGTQGKDRSTQERAIREKGLVFCDPRDLALAAALHDFFYRKSLFGDAPLNFVRISVPGFGLRRDGDAGICVHKLSDLQRDPWIWGAGSLLQPQSGTTSVS